MAVDTGRQHGDARLAARCAGVEAHKADAGGGGGGAAKIGLPDGVQRCGRWVKVEALHAAVLVAQHNVGQPVAVEILHGRLDVHGAGLQSLLDGARGRVQDKEAARARGLDDVR